MPTIRHHREVQAIARRVLADLGETITPDDSERTIAARATSMMKRLGITATWYYDCPAFVLLGSRSCLSVSGANYVPESEPVGVTNLVTVDLSPSLNGAWGDCARSFVVENGRHTDMPTLPEFKRGLDAERQLHQRVISFATRETSFEHLFDFANADIADLGFENLDFSGNVGHSIESSRIDRRFIEAGNSARLGDAKLFTFEPHIRELGGQWGFKHEDIYFFGADGKIVAL